MRANGRYHARLRASEAANSPQPRSDSCCRWSKPIRHNAPTVALGRSTRQVIPGFRRSLPGFAGAVVPGPVNSVESDEVVGAARVVPVADRRVQRDGHTIKGEAPARAADRGDDFAATPAGAP